jgi:hypothetical protein
MRKMAAYIETIAYVAARWLKTTFSGETNFFVSVLNSGLGFCTHSGANCLSRHYRQVEMSATDRKRVAVPVI